MSKKRVAIVYKYIHHYRIPIFKLLSKFSDIEYSIYAGTTSEIKIKKADIKLSKIIPSEGGIRWVPLKNLWFFKFILFQYEILKPSFYSKFETVIFLGNMYHISTWISAIVSRVLGKKVIFWTHGFIKEEKNLKGFIRKIFYMISNEILVYGSRAKNILISKGFSESKIKLIYNSLNYDFQSKLTPKKLKKSLFINRKLPIVGFIGRLTKQKKIHQIIETLSIMDGENKFNLLIIGSGQQYSRLNKLVKRYNLESFVHFAGSVYDEQENCNLISSMDVLVSPGEVGLTGVHSMTYGTPVITHNKFENQMPEYEIIKPGLTGDFFEYNDAIQGMKEIIPKYYHQREKYSKNCKDIIKEKYNPKNQLQIFNNIVI